MNDFVAFNHICKFSAQIIECIHFSLYYFLQCTKFYNNYLLYDYTAKFPVLNITVKTSTCDQPLIDAPCASMRCVCLNAPCVSQCAVCASMRISSNYAHQELQLGPSCSLAVGTSFFLPYLLISIFTLLSPSSSVSMFHFILAVPICKCLGKHSCMNS